jgi:membrane fusion protein (multidrug efflux system)
MKNIPNTLEINTKLVKTSTSLMLILLLTACTKKGDSKEKLVTPPPIVVDWIIAAPIELAEKITVSGTIKPAEETVLFSEISGRVIKINLPEGKTVKKGTLLVKFFDDDLQAQLQKAKAQLQLTKQTLGRQSELIKINGISQSELDQTTLQMNTIKGDIDVLTAQIRKTEIIAPYDGVLGLRNISLGAVVSPSLPLATIREVQTLKIDFSIPEKYSQEIKTGTIIKFVVNDDDQEFDAKVIATEQGIDASTRNLKARAQIISSNSKLTPGAFASIHLRIKNTKNAIIVPSQAIIPQGNHKSLIICYQGKAKIVKVKTGLRQTNGIEITEGIAENDTIVTTGVMFIKPDANLKLKKKD